MVQVCFYLLVNSDGYRDALYLTRRESAVIGSIALILDEGVGQTWNDCDKESYVTWRKTPRPTFKTLMILMTLICVWRVVEAMNVYSSSILRDATEQLFNSCYYCEDIYLLCLQLLSII
jgi:hypothetical protein